MTEAQQNLRKSVASTIAVLLLIAAPGGQASAQQHWVVDPTTSLAWWQMNPNYGHLWATTCPSDPNWHAGEGHTNGFDNGKGELKKVSRAANMDYRIPLYPRLDVHPVCRKALAGQFTVEDTKTLKNVHGSIFVNADSMETGSAMRNAFSHNLTAGKPQVVFTLDSIISVQPGDTIHGTAVGSLEMHGTKQPLMVLISAYPDAGGMRVIGKWQFHPRELTEKYGFSKVKLGAGVGMGLWKELHFGFDILLKQPPGQGATPGD
jgi:hypothetical protein